MGGVAGRWSDSLIGGAFRVLEFRCARCDDSAQGRLFVVVRPLLGRTGMRRLLTVAAAAALLVGLMPGIASAAWAPGVKDQSTIWSESLWSSDGSTVTQTVTAGITGDLTRVRLYCAFSGVADVGIHVGSSWASGICSSAGWWNYNFRAPFAHVTAGSQFTLQISSTDEDSVNLGIANSDYAGGAAAEGGYPIDNDGSPVTDFAFETYVMGSPTATYTWNPTSITAGTSQTVSVTAVTTFPNEGVQPQVVGPAVSDPVTHTVRFGTLPSWFTPTSIVCTSEIQISDCTLDNFQTGMPATGDGTEMTVTVTVTGIAAPPSSAGGGKGSASGTGCDSYIVDQDNCGTGSADIAVLGPAGTPAPTTTPALTATSDGRTTGGSSPWLLLSCFFGAGLAMLVVTRTAARRSRP